MTDQNTAEAPENEQGPAVLRDGNGKPTIDDDINEHDIKLLREFSPQLRDFVQAIESTGAQFDNADLQEAFRDAAAETASMADFFDSVSSFSDEPPLPGEGRPNMCGTCLHFAPVPGTRHPRTRKYQGDCLCIESPCHRHRLNEVTAACDEYEAK